MEVVTYKRLNSKARRYAYNNPTLDPDFKRLLKLYDTNPTNLTTITPESSEKCESGQRDCIDNRVENDISEENGEPSVRFQPKQKGTDGAIKSETISLLRSRQEEPHKNLQSSPKLGKNVEKASPILSKLMKDAAYPAGTAGNDPFLVKLLQNINNIDMEAVHEQAKQRPALVRDQYFEISFNNRVFKLPFLHLIVLHHCLHRDQTKHVMKIISRLFRWSIYNMNEEMDERLIDKVTRWELKPGVYSDVSALHVSAFYGNLYTVKILVRLGANVNLPTDRGNTPLILATTSSSDHRFRILAVLIHGGAHANLSNEDGVTPLHRAITDGADIPLLELLINKGEADVNAVKRRGLATPLIQAIAFRNRSVADLLVEKGADLTYTTPKKQSIFHYAVAANMPELAKKLIKVQELDGELHDESDLAGDTPFMLAVAQRNLEMMEILLEHGARLDHTNVLGKTVWDWAFAAPDRGDIMDILIKVHKESVSYEYIKGQAVPVVRLSPLHVATYRDNVKLLKKLLGKGLDPRESDKKSMNSFLHIAGAEKKRHIIGEKYENYDQLLQGLNRNEDTPLHMTARRGDAESMTLIMDMATDTLIDDFLHLKNLQHCTPLHLAMLRSTRKVALVIAEKMHVIKDTGEDLAIAEDTDLLGNSYLHAAARNNFPELCKKLLDLNVQIDQRNDLGNTPLHEAALSGSTEVVKCLLLNDRNRASEVPKDKHRTIVDLHMKNFDDRTVLHMAARCATATKDMFEVIISAIRKVDLADSLLNETDIQGNTAIHIAIKKQRRNLYGVLKALATCNYSIVNDDGDTPLHTAAKNKDPTVLATVLRVMDEEKINKPMNVANIDGKTPLMLCVESGFRGLLGKMIRDGSDLAFRSRVNGDTLLHDLVRLSVAQPELIEQWRNVYRTICYHSVKWWCMSNEIEEPDSHSKHFDLYREIAVKFLTSAVRNGGEVQQNTLSLFHLSQSSHNNFINPLILDEGAGLTVIQLAVKLGASQMFESILNTPRVFRTDVKIDKSIVPRFDVTYITPDTSKFLNQHKPHAAQSCLEMLWNVDDSSKIVKFLDITPIKQLSHNYWERYQWIYVVLMFIHIIYMSLFCKYALDVQLSPSQNTLRPNNINISDIGSNFTVGEDLGQNRQLAPSVSEIAPYGLLLIWPAIIVLYLFVHTLFRIPRWTNSKHLSRVHKERYLKRALNISLIWSMLMKLKFLGNELTNIFGFIFAFSVFLWFIFLACGSIIQVYFLVLAFCLGWVFTVVFTKGFETVHSFTVMLKYIIIIDILRFLMIFTFIFLGFSLALHAIFLHAPSTAAEFSNIWFTFFYVFRVMLSVDDPFSETFDEELSAVGIRSSIPKTIYVIFMVISAIVLMNLLIAMMSDTYSNVKAKEAEQWRVSNMKLAIGFEKQLRRLKHYVRFPVQKNFRLLKEKTELRPKSLYGSEYKICTERYYAYFYSGISLPAEQIDQEDGAENVSDQIKEYIDIKFSALSKTLQNLKTDFEKISKVPPSTTKMVDVGSDPIDDL